MSHTTDALVSLAMTADASRNTLVHLKEQNLQEDARNGVWTESDAHLQALLYIGDAIRELTAATRWLVEAQR